MTRVVDADAAIVFQSTLSVRRATKHLAVDSVTAEFQSTLSVRRATRNHRHLILGNHISIHALREESDERKE